MMADASYKAQPFWWDDLRPDAFRSTAGIEDLPGRCDVLIAGAGYSGMTAALTLANRLDAQGRLAGLTATLSLPLA